MNTLKTQSNIIVGTFLVILGFLILLKNFGLFYFNIDDLFKLWPFILIYTGVRMLPIAEEKRIWIEISVIILFFIVLISLPYISHKHNNFDEVGLLLRTSLKFII